MEITALKTLLEKDLNTYLNDSNTITIEQLIIDADAIKDAIQEHEFLHDHVAQLDESKVRERIDQDELAEIIMDIQDDLKQNNGTY